MRTPSRRRVTARLAAALGAAAGIVVLGGCSASHFAQPPLDSSLSSSQSANRLTAEQIQNYPSSISVEDLLTRHFPGLHLRGRREPGGATTVQVLGMGTPLYVVDGVPLQHTSGTLGLNPRDIEYIEVLKYGAATSLYGMRGANGVILIVTKH
jgi:TonB-dependent SusC/RagA subfamily outer membrane receptor